uniref:SCP2 domain-containing protein n=1 Tax=Scleropages formosus TaxID=113540 RepID=A0A8C9RMG7_SCLFO
MSHKLGQFSAKAQCVLCQQIRFNYVETISAFKVKDGPNGKKATWVADVKNGKSSAESNSAKKTDCTISMSDADLLALMTCKMNPQTVRQGKLKITGNMGLAMKPIYANILTQEGKKYIKISFKGKQ